MDFRLVSLLSIGAVILLLGIVLFFYKKKRKVSPDYYLFFAMGVIWFVLGFPLKNYVLSAVGLVLAAIGLMHKDKWKKNRQKWENLDNREKKWMIILMFLLGMLVLIALLVFLILS